jgi:hypothetical protein
MKFVQEMRELIAASSEAYRQKRQMQQQSILLNESFKNGIERVVGLRKRIRYRVSSRAKNKARAAALATVTQTLKNANKWNATNIKKVFNISLYLLLLDQDLAYFTGDLVLAIGDRRRAFVAKHEALLLYEASENLPHMLGREFRTALNDLRTPSEILERVSTVTSDLNKFCQRHRGFLGKIRNALAAHREQNALIYAKSLDELKPLEVMARAAELSGLLERLLQALTEVARLTSDPTVILRDMLTSNGKSNP